MSEGGEFWTENRRRLAMGVVSIAVLIGILKVMASGDAGSSYPETVEVGTTAGVDVEKLQSKAKRSEWALLDEPPREVAEVPLPRRSEPETFTLPRRRYNPSSWPSRSRSEKASGANNDDWRGDEGGEVLRSLTASKFREGIEESLRAMTRPEPADRGLRLNIGRQLLMELATPVSSTSFESLVSAYLVREVRERGSDRLIFPAMTKVFGRVSDHPSLGGNRVGIVWETAVTPRTEDGGGGHRVRLGWRATDALGTEGVETKVSFGWWSFYGHALGMSVVGALAQAGQEPVGGTADVEAYAIADFSQRGERVMERTLDQLQRRKPKFELRRGELLGLTVPEDVYLVLEDG